MLRARGYTVTLLPGVKLNEDDKEEQERLSTMKNSYSLKYSGGAGGERWFATSAERRRCLANDEIAAFGTGTAWKLPHPALAKRLSSLGQDAVLVVEKLTGESTGATINMFSSSNALPKSRATVQASLALRSGSIAWTGEGQAEGALRPPVEQAALQKLHSFVDKAPEVPKGMSEAEMEQGFNATMEGDLEHAPTGSTLGPSLWATLVAATRRTITVSGL